MRPEQFGSGKSLDICWGVSFRQARVKKFNQPVTIGGQKSIGGAIEGIDGLAAVCRKILKQDPFSGYIFVFRNKPGTALKILIYDGQGFWLCQKRLSKGRFKWWPKNVEDESYQLSAHEKKGHGRNGVNAYKGAKKVKVPHETLKSGNDCPACEKGKLYGEKPPARIVRITGGAPLQATVYELQRLRCNLCGQIFTAQAPEHVGKDKYDAKSGAMLALLKYGSGVPLYRLGQLQASLGMPLPPSTQWEIIESVADKIHPVYPELIRQGAQGRIVYNEDTTVPSYTKIRFYYK